MVIEQGTQTRELIASTSPPLPPPEMFSGQTKSQGSQKTQLTQSQKQLPPPCYHLLSLKAPPQIWSGSLKIVECVVTGLVDSLCKNILSKEINLSAAYFSTALGSKPYFPAAISISGILCVVGGSAGGEGQNLPRAWILAYTVMEKSVLVREESACEGTSDYEDSKGPRSRKCNVSAHSEFPRKWRIYSSF